MAIHRSKPKKPRRPLPSRSHLKKAKNSPRNVRVIAKDLPAVLIVQEAVPQLPGVRYFSVSLEVFPGKLVKFGAPFIKDDVLKLIQDVPDTHEAKLRCLNLVQDLFAVRGVISCDVGNRYTIGVYKGSAFNWEDILEDVVRAICYAVYHLDPKQVDIRYESRSTAKDKDQKSTGN